VQKTPLEMTIRDAEVVGAQRIQGQEKDDARTLDLHIAFRLPERRCRRIVFTRLVRMAGERPKKSENEGKRSVDPYCHLADSSRPC
jgi:hypothetical protein